MGAYGRGGDARPGALGATPFAGAGPRTSSAAPHAALRYSLLHVERLAEPALERPAASMALSPGVRAAVGKRAGLTSGLLGILCVLGEFCFLFPDLLVTRDALPIYAAHIGLMRGILQGSIFATIATGALG